MACAPADGRFQRLSKESPYRIMPFHKDLLPDAKTVVVWFIPSKHHIQMDNTRGKRPSLSWGRAYFFKTK
ncbi:MAG: hypothetical protein U5R30_15980 [Deltaproteobacteria bacterium]|nr:hypothetical protein [Deltaproteobacteria bacterium]